MKKILVLMLTLAMTLSLAACGKSDSGTSNTAKNGDLAYVKDKGTLVVGITDFEPMDYKDENGDWIGFEIGRAHV